MKQDPFQKSVIRNMLEDLICEKCKQETKKNI